MPRRRATAPGRTRRAPRAVVDAAASSSAAATASAAVGGRSVREAASPAGLFRGQAARGRRVRQVPVQLRRGSEGRRRKRRWRRPAPLQSAQFVAHERSIRPRRWWIGKRDGGQAAGIARAGGTPRRSPRRQRHRWPLRGTSLRPASQQQQRRRRRWWGDGTAFRRPYVPRRSPRRQDRRAIRGSGRRRSGGEPTVANARPNPGERGRRVVVLPSPARRGLPEARRGTAALATGRSRVRRGKGRSPSSACAAATASARAERRQASPARRRRVRRRSDRRSKRTHGRRLRSTERGRETVRRERLPRCALPAVPAAVGALVVRAGRIANDRDER